MFIDNPHQFFQFINFPVAFHLFLGPLLSNLVDSLVPQALQSGFQLIYRTSKEKNCQW
jgi:hypothetical protein